MTYYDESGKGRAVVTGAAAALTLAALALIAHSGGVWHQLGTTLTSSLSGLPPAGSSSSPRCRRWESTHSLGGGCMAELDRSITNISCCGGEDYACKLCPAPKIQALHCVSPRHTLLLPAPGCGVEPGSNGGGGAPADPAACSPLSADQVLAGQWIKARRAVARGSPQGTPPWLFQPDWLAGRPPPLAGRQALEQLWAAGFDRVVVSGDSTVRHFYNRLITLLRQQPMAIDGGGIAHAHYKLQAWRDDGGTAGSTAGAFATDELWVSPAANFVKGKWDVSLMEDGLSQLMNRSFGGTTDGGSSTAADAAGRSLTVDFLVGAKAAWQQPHVQRYFAADGGGSGRGSRRGGAGDWRRRTLLVLSQCVWEQTQVFREGWLDFVEEMRGQVGQVVLLTCPLDRIRRPEHAEGRKVVDQRNAALRQLVSARLGGSADHDAAAPPPRKGVSAARPLMLVDIDGMTQRLPADLELGVAPKDFHYQCMLATWTTYNSSGPIEWSGGDGRPRPAYPTMRYERLLVPPAGTCADPVNYAAWELLLGMLCPRGRL